MTRKIQTAALIFDIDGTLWDVRELVARAWSKAASEYAGKAVHIEAGQLTALLGKPMPEIFKQLFPGQTEEAYQKIAEVCEQQQAKAMETEGGRLYPGVAETLPCLAETYPLYIVSNCQCGYIEAFLRLSGLSPFFKDWLCFGDTGLSKGQTMLRLMEKSGLQNIEGPTYKNNFNAAYNWNTELPAEGTCFPAVYLGDILGDALACKEAGIPFIWASYGFGEVGPDDYIEKIGQFSELSKILF